MVDQPKKKKKSHEPELLEHSYLEGSSNNGKGTPYIFLLMVVFVILSFIWKGFVSESPQAEGKDVPTISRSDIAKSKDMMR